MNTKVLAGALVGFLLGGLTVSIAAQLEPDCVPPKEEHSVQTPIRVR